MLDDTRRLELRTQIKESSASGDVTGTLSAARQLIASGGKQTDVSFCATIFGKLGVALTQHPGIVALRTYIVRSVTVEPLLPHITAESALSGYALELHVGGYGSYVEEMLSGQSGLARFAPDLILIMLDLEDVAGLLPDLCADGVGASVDEEIAGCVQRLSHLIRTVRSNSKARIVLQGFVVPDTSSLGPVGDANLRNSLSNAVTRLNSGLAGACAGISDCVFFDVDQLAARQGRLHWRDTRLFLASRLPVAGANFGVFARGLVRSINALYKAPRKILCTDLDNTLWGGVLGEDGVSGIVTGTTFPGTPFHNYQRYLKQLSSRGVLLAAVSKNNEDDVREAFQIRAADLALTLDDFAALKINWNEKSQSLRELAKELSLGLDAFVFVDDNPVEAEAIRQQIPEVAVIDAPVDEPWRLLDLLSEQPLFDVLRVTEDDRNRLTDYKAQVERVALENSSGGRDEFLGSLGIVCTFLSALDAPLARAVQLLAKTNQFNLTTRRHSAAQIEEFASAPSGQAVVVRVRDRFGDAGVVGLALARNQGADCVIDSLLLSCRVIGRGIETAMLSYIAEGAARNGATRLVGEFIPTKKNAPCASFYPDHGFSPVRNTSDRENQALIYELDLATSAPPMPPWITPEGFHTHELASAVVSS